MWAFVSFRGFRALRALRAPRAQPMSYEVTREVTACVLVGRPVRAELSRWWIACCCFAVAAGWFPLCTSRWILRVYAGGIDARLAA